MTAQPSNNGIVWEDPPAKRQAGANWIERLQPLLEHPGQWARVGEVGRSSAWAVARQLTNGIKVHPPGRWEFRAAGNPENPVRGYVYARYLGPEDGRP